MLATISRELEEEKRWWWVQAEESRRGDLEERWKCYRRAACDECAAMLPIALQLEGIRIASMQCERKGTPTKGAEKNRVHPDQHGQMFWDGLVRNSRMAQRAFGWIGRVEVAVLRCT
jgi:hypothetical protein